ncbi:MAG: phosphotransferase family protein [Pseudomonadota bacterium]
MSDATAPGGDALDLDALSAYVARVVPSVGRVHAIEKFQGGQSNPTFRLETDGGPVVLRAKPPGALLKSAHQVAREHRVMSALRSSDVPVPEMLHLSGEGEASPIGRQFFLMRFVEGVIHWDPSLDALDPDGRRAVTDSMNRTLAALHHVDPEAVGLADFGRPGNYFARQLSRWTQQYRASETDPIEDMDRVIRWLEAALPADDGSVSLVHGDYRLDNMMFDATSHEVVAVLDWELSTLGHPVADLAYQCMQWRLPSDSAFKGLGGLDRAGLGLPVESDYVAQYCERTGRDAIPNWNYYLAFNFFRLGAILQGVYKRALAGNASNPERGRRMGQAVPLLAAAALDTIETQP